MDRLLAVLLGSLVVLGQTCAGYHDSFWYVFALTISGTSLVISLVLLILSRTSSGKAQELMCVSAAVLACLWLVGTAFMTVKAPYVVTGNGYFGSWVALIFSWLLAVEHSPSLKAPLDGLVANGGVSVAMLTLASLVVFCQTVWHVIDHHGVDHFEVVWVLVCSGFSLFVLLLLHVQSVSEKIKNHFTLIAVFLFLWWSVGWFVATFDFPYRLTGNGFFGCWVALFYAFELADTAGGLGLQQRAESTTRNIPRALLGVTLGSAVVLVAITYNGCWGSHHSGWCSWAFVCSCISLVVCAFLCIVMAIGSGSKVEGALPHVAVFLLLWWTIGTGIMTFEHPFTATTNGYFGAWLAVVCSAVLCHDHAQSLQDFVGRFGEHGRLLPLLFLASVTLLVQVLFDTFDDWEHKNLPVAWIVAAGTLSICLVMMLTRSKEDIGRILMVVMLLLWAGGVGVLTFDAPYLHTGNAYFACWCGLCVSALAVWRLYPDVVRRAMPEAGEPPAAVVGVSVV
ncbi:unnamed protein product [Prorocentrum cordatum]|uniref:DUF2157 domain-containing protein n=1 Tax=Prorocentrum cordatum TaxID=2364126 RepID=A0ABN9Y8Y4_9DINO|nr:unnamed protein product [Polarella glacialis]